MNRYCTIKGCTAYGGSSWVDAHEAVQHGRCVCGWVGPIKNMPWHVSQRVRHSPRAEQERELHFLRGTAP